MRGIYGAVHTVSLYENPYWQYASGPPQRKKHFFICYHAFFRLAGGAVAGKWGNVNYRPGIGRRGGLFPVHVAFAG